MPDQPGRWQVEQVRRALNRLSSLAHDDLRREWGHMIGFERAQITRALTEGWVGIAGHYGDLAAALAADLVEVQAANIGIRARLEIAAGVDAERATRRLGWVMSTANPMGNALTVLDELVKQPYRSTVQDSAWKSGAAWARVPSGAETCAFCRMLASRGGVYATQALAGDKRYGKAYHGDCDCVAVLVRGPQDYPTGYHPDALYDQYDAAKSAAGYSENPLSRTNPNDGPADDLKAVLAQLREQQGTH